MKDLSLILKKIKQVSIDLQNKVLHTKIDMKASDGKKTLEITLKYGPNNEKVINGLRRISKPGLRVTADSKHLPLVLRGLGIAIISTSKGLLTDKACRQANVGGEVVCYVY